MAKEYDDVPADEFDDADHEVVGHWARGFLPGDLDGDGASLEDADPDGKEAGAVQLGESGRSPALENLIHSQ